MSGRMERVMRLMAWALRVGTEFHTAVAEGTPRSSSLIVRFKLADKLMNSDAEMLARGTQTIITQVQSMKRMVDDFRDYARLPAPVTAQMGEDFIHYYGLVAFSVSRAGGMRNNFAIRPRRWPICCFSAILKEQHHDPAV